MKYSRHFCAAAILTLVMAFPAFAGDMGYPIATEPPPQQRTAPGDMGYPITGTGDIHYPLTSEIDPWAGIAGSLIKVLSAF